MVDLLAIGTDLVQFPKDAFDTDGRLNKATLTSVQVTGMDFVSGEDKTVTLSANWDGIGETFHRTSMARQIEEGCIAFAKTNIFERSAHVEAGLSVDGTDLTFVPNDEAELEGFNTHARISNLCNK